MHPILFQAPGFTLYTQTVLLAIAFMAGLLLAISEGRQAGIPRFELSTVILLGFLAAILGGRAFFLLLTFDAANFTLRELCVVGTLDGGFALHGGLLFGGLAGWLTARYYRLPVWRTGDVLAPGLALAMFFLRLGCLMNGCDYGIPTTRPWGIPLHGSLRHPIQLYEGLGNLALLPVLAWLNRTGRTPGTTLLVYLCLSSLLRCGVDIFRDDPLRYAGLTIPQYLALGIALVSGVFLIFRPAPHTKSDA